MIEKKRMWAVTRDFEIIERVAIVEEGKVLMSKKPGCNDSCYTDGWNIIRFFDTEESAKEWIENEENDIRAMAPKVKKFINKMDSLWSVREKLHIKKTDYLGRHGIDNDEGYRQMYNDECNYAKKLETFAKCRMLNIDGYMIHIDKVREVKWYGCNKSADEDCPNEWRAVLTTPNGDEFVTNSEEDVRLVWATIGKCSDNWFIDEDIDYSKSEENDE